MAFKDILLQLRSYPDPTSPAAIEQAVGFAAMMGATLSALTFRIEIPNAGSTLVNLMLDMPEIVASERQKSETNVRTLVDLFESAARRQNVAHRQSVESCTTSELAAIVAERARSHDVTMIPVSKEAGLQQYIAECVFFGSGRPTIIFPETPKRAGPLSVDVVGIAWDFSRPAARAVADALPILRRARTVHAVTITQEKTIDTARSGAELARHLACHGIDTLFEAEAVGGRSIGQAIEDFALARNLDLLVMGAFGHSRARDFILGGATKAIVADPPLPVLLSH